MRTLSVITVTKTSTNGWTRYKRETQKHNVSGLYGHKQKNDWQLDQRKSNWKRQKLPQMARDNTHSRLMVHTYYTVSILRQSLQRQQRVVRLHDDVRNFILIWENGIRLDQLLWEPVITQQHHYIYHACPLPFIFIMNIQINRWCGGTTVMMTDLQCIDRF